MRVIRAEFFLDEMNHQATKNGSKRDAAFKQHSPYATKCFGEAPPATVAERAPTLHEPHHSLPVPPSPADGCKDTWRGVCCGVDGGGGGGGDTTALPDYGSTVKAEIDRLGAAVSELQRMLGVVCSVDVSRHAKYIAEFVHLYSHTFAVDFEATWGFRESTFREALARTTDVKNYIEHRSTGRQRQERFNVQQVFDAMTLLNFAYYGGHSQRYDCGELVSLFVGHWTMICGVFTTQDKQCLVFAL